MEFGEILELERKNQERELQLRLAKNHYESQQRRINQEMFMISQQMHQNTMALFAGIFNENK